MPGDFKRLVESPFRESFGCQGNGGNDVRQRQVFCLADSLFDEVGKERGQSQLAAEFEGADELVNGRFIICCGNDTVKGRRIFQAGPAQRIRLFFSQFFSAYPAARGEAGKIAVKTGWAQALRADLGAKCTKVRQGGRYAG